MTNTMRYETPVGSFRTWEEAAVACERADFDPCECIKIRDLRLDMAPTTVDVSYEIGPGGVIRLSNPVRCF